MISSILGPTKLKKLIADFGCNIIASILLVFGLQIVVYPSLAKLFDAGTYGVLLTFMGIVNTITSSLGITLNNTRLIGDADYKDKGISGDFNILLIGACCSSLVIVVILTNFIFIFNSLDKILISLCVVFGVINSYISVAYRLSLNYTMIVVLNIVVCTGYLTGTFLAYKSGLWVIAFLVGELFGFILLSANTGLIKEPLKISSLFKKTAIKYLLLIATGLIGATTLYLDRFIIYPVLGGEVVSTFTIASFFGKSLGLVMTPISSVLLSYYSQKNFYMDFHRFLLINFFLILIAIIFFFLAKFFSVFFTGLLYPTLINAAEQYILIANTAAIIGVLASMISPIVLRYSSTYWLVAIEITYLAAYFILGMILLHSYGLNGFCAALICVNTLKVLMLYFAGGKTLLKREESDKCIGT